MTTARSFLAVFGLLFALLAIGCGPGPKDMQITALQEEINRLQGDNQDLTGRLTRALSDRDQARGHTLDLRQQLANLQAEMARMRDSATQEGPWTELPGIAWQDIADNILFDSGKANLRSAGRETLKQITTDIQQRYPGRQVWIVGHTDNDPIRKSKWKDNLELSAQRACTVHRELCKLGLDPHNMIAAGQGEFHPKVENTPKTKHLNRRVQIIAVEIPETSRIAESSEHG